MEEQEPQTTYEAEAQRLEELLSTSGISIENFSQLGKTYLQSLSTLAEILNLESVETGSYINALADVVAKHENALEQQNEVNKIKESLRTHKEKVLLERDQVKKLAQQLQQQSIEREQIDDSEEMAQKIKELNLKQKKYKRQTVCFSRGS